MKITRVEIRRKSLVGIFADGEEIAELDRQTFLTSRYSQGSEISEEELIELQELSQYNRAKNKALYLLQLRSRSRKELVTKLLQDKYPDEVCDAVADRMEELGFINDEDYARRYCSDLMNRKGYSKRRAVFELGLKGIDRYMAEEIADELEEELEEDPADKIAALIEKKYPRWSEDEKIKRRAFGAMARLGYDFDDINSAFYRLEHEE